MACELTTGLDLNGRDAPSKSVCQTTIHFSRAPSGGERALAAVTFACLQDGLVATVTTWQAHGGGWVSLLAGAEAAAFLALPLTLLALPVAWLLERPSSIHLGRRVREAVAGDATADERVGIILFALALSAAVALVWRAALRVGEIQSTRVAVTVAVAASLVSVAVSALVAALLTRWCRGIPRLEGERALRIPAWLPVSELLVTAIAIVSLYVFLPPSHAVTLAAALVGFGPVADLVSRCSPGSRGSLRLGRWAAGAVLVTLASIVALDRLSNVARLGVLARAPYASLVLTSGRRLVDRDRDGYSAILGGGDCNDHDPAIHPNAIDVPDNGVDENCSGADAHPYAPPPHPGVAASAASRTNVILVHVDALRPDHLGSNGYRRRTSPNLDRFGAESVRFENAYSGAPSTRFAMAQIFTGLDVARIPQRRGTDVDFWLLPEAVTLAERLAPLGYDRVGFTLSYVLQHIHDVGQGFRTWTTPWDVNEWRETYHDSAELTTNAALDYLKTVSQDGSAPYLLFLHYGCVHDPYITHAPWDFGSRPVDAYDSALAYCDSQLGRLFDSLKARGDDKNTAVIVFSDHGELFGEHGVTKHGNTLYQPDLRVVLMARVPGAEPKTIQTPVVLTDLLPTLETLTGLPHDPASQAWDLAPAIRGEPLAARPLYFYGDLWRDGVHFEERGMLAADGETKFIRDISHGMSFLFDLAHDPDEISNLTDSQPALAARLSEEVDSWDSYQSAGMRWDDSQRASTRTAAK